MNSKVLIKQHPNGINVVLDKNLSNAELEQEVASHFKESAPFFGKCKLTVMFTGRVLTNEEEDRLCTIIEENSEITILCVFIEDKVRDSVFVRARKIMEDQAVLRAAMSVSPKRQNRVSEYLTWPGDIPVGETCRTSRNILVLGDIPEGAVLASEQNIVVLGSIHGTAMAGCRQGGRIGESLSDLAGAENGHHVILAANIQPERLVIDDISYRPAPAETKSSGLFGRRNRQPEQQARTMAAYVEVDHVVTSVVDESARKVICTAAGLNL